MEAELRNAGVSFAVAPGMDLGAYVARASKCPEDCRAGACVQSLILQDALASFLVVCLIMELRLRCELHGESIARCA